MLKQTDQDLDKMKELSSKELLSPTMEALMSKEMFLLKMEQLAETKDTKIKIKIKRTKLNSFNYLDNLKDSIIKMAYLMLTLKESLKDSLSDSAELE